MKNKIIFCGGDRRLLYAASLFSENGYESLVWQGAAADDALNISRAAGDLSTVSKGTCAVILPIPSFTQGGKLVCTDGDRDSFDREYIFKAIGGNAPIFGGKISDLTHRIAGEYNCRLFDYSAFDNFSLYNAVPTAEATIKIIMELLKSTIWGSCFTVIGYGKCGRALAKRLLALGGRITVAARSPKAQALAECEGMSVMSVKDYLNTPPHSHITVNTVPCRIIDDETCTRDNCRYFIDIASAPGGFTDEARAHLGDRLTVALSLPGKYFPKTAGSIIYKTIMGHLEKEECKKW